MGAVTICSDFRAQEEEMCHHFHLSPSICHKVMGPDAMILVFLYLVLCWLFHSPPSPSSRGSSVPLCFLPSEWYHPHIWGCWCFSHLSWSHLITHPAQHFSWCAWHISYICVKSNLRDRVLGRVEKDSFVAMPGKGGHSRLMPSKPCVPTWGR